MAISIISLCEASNRTVLRGHQEKRGYRRCQYGSYFLLIPQQQWTEVTVAFLSTPTLFPFIWVFPLLLSPNSLRSASFSLILQINFAKNKQKNSSGLRLLAFPNCPGITDKIGGLLNHHFKASVNWRKGSTSGKMVVPDKKQRKQPL